MPGTPCVGMCQGVPNIFLTTPLNACVWAQLVAIRLVLRDLQHLAIPCTERSSSQSAQAGGRHCQPEAAAGGGQAAVHAPRPGHRGHDAHVSPGELCSCGIHAGHQQARAASKLPTSPGSGGLPACTAWELLPNFQCGGLHFQQLQACTPNELRPDPCRPAPSLWPAQLCFASHPQWSAGRQCIYCAQQPLLAESPPDLVVVACRPALCLQRCLDPRLPACQPVLHGAAA